MSDIYALPIASWKLAPQMRLKPGFTKRRFAGGVVRHTDWPRFREELQATGGVPIRAVHADGEVVRRSGGAVVGHHGAEIVHAERPRGFQKVAKSAVALFGRHVQAPAA